MTVWTIKAIDVMHLAKDTMRGQLNQTQINTVINNLALFGITHIALPIPFDEDADYPPSTPTPGYVAKWLTPIRLNGLKVIWRGSWNSFENGPSAEGNYNFVRMTPTNASPRALGVAATVLSGADTTSYLYKTWNWVKTHGSWFQAGDVMGPCPEPENQGVGGLTTDMFSSHNVLGQWLVDIKTVVDNALEVTLGYAHEAILTGMTSINGGTIEVGQIGSAYWTQIGRVCMDHYITSGTYSSSLDTIHTNAGVDEIYIGEYGTTGGVGSPANDAARAVMITNDFTTFISKFYIKGVCYWEAVGGASDAPERLLDDTSNYAIYPSSFAAITRFFASSAKKITGLSLASAKSVNGLAKSSIKTINNI